MSYLERMRALGIEGLDDFISTLGFYADRYPEQRLGETLLEALDHAEAWQVRMMLRRAAQPEPAAAAAAADAHYNA